jgi:hypothetical protein
MDQQFVLESLRVNYKAVGSIRPQSDNLTNDSIASDVDGREVSFVIESVCRTRSHQHCARSCRATKKIASINQCIHRSRRLPDV